MEEKDLELLNTRAHEWDVRTNNDKAVELIQKLDEVLDMHPDYLFSISQEAGLLERAINMKFADGTQTFMNPIFKVADRPKLCREFDRITKKEYIVPRFSNVELVFQDSLGRIKAIKLEDVGAMILHQAMDMLDGVYPSDLGLEVLPEFDEATEEEREEVIKEYLNNYLGKRYQELDELLTSDDETKDKWSALKFMAAKSRGEIDDGGTTEELSNRKKKFITKLAKQIKAKENKLKFWRKKK